MELNWADEEELFFKETNRELTEYAEKAAERGMKAKSGSKTRIKAVRSVLAVTVHLWDVHEKLDSFMDPEAKENYTKAFALLEPLVKGEKINEEYIPDHYILRSFKIDYKDYWVELDRCLSVLRKAGCGKVEIALGSKAFKRYVDDVFNTSFTFSQRFDRLTKLVNLVDCFTGGDNDREMRRTIAREYLSYEGDDVDVRLGEALETGVFDPIDIKKMKRHAIIGKRLDLLPVLMAYMEVTI